MQPRIIADYRCVTGENPLWHPREKCLYWVDIPLGRLFRYFPAGDRHEICYEGHITGGFTIQADGALLLFLDKGTIRIWHNGFIRTVLEGIPEESGGRFNDVIADPRGRVFCGTIRAPEPGALYRLNTDGKLDKVLDGVGCSNGLGFSPDRKFLYYTDSPRREIYRFDYEEDTGRISNRQVLIRTAEKDGVPDGLTVDAEGYIWSAFWGGGCLARFSPAGAECRRILFPASKVSSVTFGGDDYTDMYVTTAGGDKRESEGPGAGALFHLTAGVRGLPEFHSSIR